MLKKLGAQPVRAVILHGAVGALGEDDEIHTSPELQGFTAAWLPGDHGLCLIVGGGVVDGVQIEPAVTVVLPWQSPDLLAHTISRAQAPGRLLALGEPVFGETIGLGGLAAKVAASRSTEVRDMAMVMAYKRKPTLPPFPGRTHVVEICTHGSEFRVHLTEDEADDLKVVLKYKPAWSVDERSPHYRWVICWVRWVEYLVELLYLCSEVAETALSVSYETAALPLSYIGAGGGL